MNQPAQQSTLFPAGAGQSMERAWLTVPAAQISRLRSAGADYVDDFITPEEEFALCKAIGTEEWQIDLQRRVQHYGYRYDYTERNINADNQLGALPPWVGKIAERLVWKNVFDQSPDQLIVNEYQPGQGIAPHTDRDCFGPMVASLSLGSDCMMKIFPHPKTKDDAFEIVLKRRSLLVFEGKSRNRWRHAIMKRKSDEQCGHKVPRGLRISLTFRTIK